ncbi:MAG: hypothetical protein WBQ94_26505 [Terracidiphilus sp.]
MAPVITSVLCEDFQQPTTSSISDDPRWQLALRIVASKNFAKSSFLTNFLLYVCDRELRGRAQEITEHQIGIQALGRPATYNPGEDNIVRNYARLLRKRLEEYFKTEGKDETLRIDIPRGRYIPIFCGGDFGPELPTPALMPSRTSTNAGIEDTTSFVQPVPSTISRPSLRVGVLLLTSFVLVVVLSAVWFGIWYFNHRTDTLSHQLWTQVFSRDRETLIVPADSGFGILQNLTRHPVHLSDYVSGAYLSRVNSIPGVDGRNLNDLSTQRYTSVVDLNIVSSLSRLPELPPDHFAIRYARDLRMDDLKHSNAIFLGSQHTNPWVELFQKDMNFVLEYQPEVDDSAVVNRHPIAGESAVYRNAWADDSHRTYAVVAFIPSLDGMGHVVLLEGLNMAGTQAAADFLLNERTIAPILKKVTMPDGRLRTFELLLETNSIGANAPEARVIAERYDASPHQ